jgi:hypothetical protein
MVRLGKRGGGFPPAISRCRSQDECPTQKKSARSDGRYKRLGQMAGVRYRGCCRALSGRYSRGPQERLRRQNESGMENSSRAKKSRLALPIRRLPPEAPGLLGLGACQQAHGSKRVTMVPSPVPATVPAPSTVRRLRRFRRLQRFRQRFRRLQRSRRRHSFWTVRHRRQTIGVRR